jgi:hypothetical protein
MTFDDILAQIPKMIQWESLMTVVSSSLAMNGASLEEIGNIPVDKSLFQFLPFNLGAKDAKIKLASSPPKASLISAR